MTTKTFFIILTMTMTPIGNFIPINNYKFKTYKSSKHNHSPQNLYLTPTYDLAYPWIHSTKNALKFSSFGPPPKPNILTSQINDTLSTNTLLSLINLLNLFSQIQKKFIPIKTGNNITKPK